MEILNPPNENVSLRKDTKFRVIVRLLKAELTKVAASHMWQMVPSDGAEGQEGMASTQGPLRQELQTQTPQNTAERYQLTKLLQDHRDIFATKEEPPGLIDLVSMILS